MKIVKATFENGWVGEYISDFKPGDLITAYESGLHRFIKYEKRKGETPLVYYTRVYNANGKQCKSKKVLVCDASYCRPAIEYIMATIEQKKEEIELLETIKDVYV